MKKEDLKNGMSFVMRYGEKRFIINDRVYGLEGEYRLDSYDSLSGLLTRYKEDFTHNIHSDMDIMEIYNCDNELIWERDETDWASVPVGTKVLVRDADCECWETRFFVKYEPNNKVKFKVLTDDLSDIISWRYCKLIKN